jgi:hypothetical protein
MVSLLSKRVPVRAGTGGQNLAAAIGSARHPADDRIALKY